jgi:hypothetical protein
MRTLVNGVRPWRHDLAGCLHACAATLLAQRGLDPVQILGCGWVFRYSPGDFRREEYYFPTRPGESLFAALTPHHRVASRWHTPADADAGWTEVRDMVAGGTPVAVAVDNFHLHFRPAYRDVHANHLIIVYGFDESAGTARILDAVPPQFDGDIPLADLRAARGSANEGAHDRDMFFADQPIGHRWLELITGEGPATLDRVGVAEVLRRNCETYADEGRGALRVFLTEMQRQLAAGDSVADELFVVAGTALAVTGLHAGWLADAGRRLGTTRLVELGREVECVAHHWTALRILAALTRHGETSVARLARRHRELRTAYDQAFARIDDWVEEPC